MSQVQMEPPQDRFTISHPAVARASIFEGMTIDEIAERFGWDPNSVRSALSLARRAIRAALERSK